MICPNCKAHIPDRSAVCEYCGSPLSGNTEPKPSASGNRTLVIVLAAVLGVLVLAVALMAVLLLRKRPLEDPGTAASGVSASGASVSSSAHSGASADSSAPAPPKDPAGSVNRTDPEIRHNRSFVRSESLTEYDNDDYSRAVVDFYDVLEIEEIHGDGTKALMEAYADRENGYEAQIKKNRSFAIDVMKNSPDDTEYFYVGNYEDTKLYRSDSRVFSYIITRHTPSSNSGGFVALTDHRMETVCIDAQSGEPVALTDIVRDTERLSRLATDALFLKYNDMKDVSGRKPAPDREEIRKRILDLMEEKAMNASMMYGYAPAYLGLVLSFHRDTIVPQETGDSVYYSEPFMTVTIPYTADPELFTPAYTALPEGFVTELQSGVEYLLETGGETVPFTVTQGMREESYGDYIDRSPDGTCSVSIGNGGTQTLSVFDTTLSLRGGDAAYPTDGVLYLARDNGKYYLWVQYEERTAIGIRTQMHAYAVEDGACRYLGMTEDFFDSENNMPLDPSNMAMERYFHMMRFGDAITATSAFTAKLQDGMPVMTEPFYSVTDTSGYITLKDLVLRDAASGKDVTVPAGTWMEITKTDGESYVIVHADVPGCDCRIEMKNGEVETIGGEVWYDVLNPGWGSYGDGMFADGRDPYDELLERMYRALESGAFDGELPGASGLFEMNYDGMGTDNAGYVITDIDGNGTEELLILDLASEPAAQRIIALFTCVDGEPVLLAEGWYRNALYLLDDGELYTEGSGGADLAVREFCQFAPDGTSLLVSDYYFTGFPDGDSANNGPEDLGWYYNRTGDTDVSLSAPAGFTLDEGFEIWDDVRARAQTFGDARSLRSVYE